MAETKCRAFLKGKNTTECFSECVHVRKRYCTTGKCVPVTWPFQPLCFFPGVSHPFPKRPCRECPSWGILQGLWGPWRGCWTGRAATAAKLALSFGRKEKAWSLPHSCWDSPRQLDCCIRRETQRETEQDQWLAKFTSLYWHCSNQAAGCKQTNCFWLKWVHC